MNSVDEKYQIVLQQLINKIKGSRQRIASVANSELLTTYWEIGKVLLDQSKKITETLANDLKVDFPNMNGFSKRNLEYMQTFAAAWPYFPFTRPVAAQLHGENQPSKLEQPLLSGIPWTHHMIILDKAETDEERLFYIKKVLVNGWSANLLNVNIETGLFQREGKTITKSFEEKRNKLKETLAKVTCNRSD